GIRHPEKVNRIIAGSALCKRDGAPNGFWTFMKTGTIENMPNVYKDEYKKVAPDPLHLLVMFNKCAKRMLDFKDISDDLLRSIKAPVLIVIGNADVMTPEHALQMCRLIPNSELAILPGGHGEYI